jgi:hypothetical protein
LIDLSLTQIDPATLAELPDDVRQDLLRTLAAPQPGAQRSAVAAAAAAALQEQEEPTNASEEAARLLRRDRCCGFRRTWMSSSGAGSVICSLPTS